MKNNKGFTLVELMAVLVIMALLMAVAFPNFTDLSNKVQSNYSRSSQILIKNAAKMYVNNNKQEVENSIQKNGNYCLPIGKLIAYEYLDAEAVSEVKISDNKCIVVTKNETNYQYNLNSSELATGDYLPPVITITGANCKSVMNVNSYTDFDSTCTIKVSDNVNSTKTFKPIKEKEQELLTNNDEIKLSKVVVQQKNKIFITYSAEDTTGNKALPLQVQLILPE